MARVLVVDDFEEIRILFKLVVTRAGHECIEARDGLEGLELARRDPPALVISDIMMPSMDGFEFIRRLRAEPSLAQVPVVIASSAYHHAEAMNLASGLGVARVLTKPVNAREMLETIVSCIGSGAARSAPPEVRQPRSHLAFLAPPSDAPDAARGQRLLDLVALAEELARADGPQTALDLFCRRARDLIGARAAIVAVIDPLSGRCLQQAAIGWPDGTPALLASAPPAGTPLRDTCHGAPPLRLLGDVDPSKSLGLTDPTPRASCLGVHFGSAAYPVGCLVFLDSLSANGFSRDDAQLATVLAVQGGSTFEKRMLLVEAQRRAAALAEEVTARRATEKRLQALSQRLVQVQEEERRRLARELHDEIGQLLTGFKLKLEAVAERFPGDVSDALDRSLLELRDLIARTRSLSLDLRPSMLDDHGLKAALPWLVQRFEQQTAIRVELEMDDSGLEGRFVSEVEITAYRIVQEALTNVARHAGIALAHVRLQTQADVLVIRVADRGAGFDSVAPPPDKDSSGLTGMAERAASIGGRLTVVSAPGAGTIVTAELPFEAPLDGGAE